MREKESVDVCVHTGKDQVLLTILQLIILKRLMKFTPPLVKLHTETNTSKIALSEIYRDGRLIKKTLKYRSVEKKDF